MQATELEQHLQEDLEIVSGIEVVPKILDVVCRTTGMGFAAVARVTEDHWLACSVLDKINFGLKAGGELVVETTICHEIRQSREPVVIDNVSSDDVWCQHRTPAQYGFQSYISVPIILADGSFFGTLCAIDPQPARLNTPETVGMFQLFAELLANHVDAARKLAVSESALLEERAVSELREQFIAVLGHDLRAPMRAISSFAELLAETPLNERALTFSHMIRTSATRMQILIDNLLDLARGRRGGLPLNRDASEPLEPVLWSVIAEMEAGTPNQIRASFAVADPVYCDRSRIAQLFSNLLSNALSYGSADEPVRVEAISHRNDFELSVINRGEPIPPEALARLFHPFYRSAVQKNREGLGLGLYIAHEIAIAHGGTLEARSAGGETRFTFRMPVAAASNT